MQTAVDILRETFFLFEFIQILRGPVNGGENYVDMIEGGGNFGFGRIFLSCSCDRGGLITLTK